MNYIYFVSHHSFPICVVRHFQAMPKLADENVMVLPAGKKNTCPAFTFAFWPASSMKFISPEIKKSISQFVPEGVD